MTDTPPLPADAECLADLTAARERDASGLSVMERAFAEHALELIGQGEKFWRKEAAKRAGYAEPRGSAYELVRRPHVIAFMSRSLTEAAETVKVDRSFVLFRAVTNMAACEAVGDYRTAARFLDIIARHADVGAFTMEPAAGDQGGRLSLPFDVAALGTDDLNTLVAILRKGGGGPRPTE